MRKGTTLLALLWVAACSAAEAAPREIRPGEDVCERCHMTVDDPARAAQWLGADGRALMFDEPGCLVAWRQGRPQAGGAAFVADRAGTGWLRAEEATWVRTRRAGGMGSGLEAYRDPEAARARAAEGEGRLLSWEEALAEEVEDAHAH